MKVGDRVECDFNGKQYKGKIVEDSGLDMWLVQCGTSYLPFCGWQLRVIEPPEQAEARMLLRDAIRLLQEVESGLKG